MAIYDLIINFVVLLWATFLEFNKLFYYTLLQIQMTNTNQDSKLRYLKWVPFIIAIVIYLKNAWITEDAYIMFRSLDQLDAGRGPVWNSHERVQVYTSHLWYWLLAPIRLYIGSDFFINTLLFSFLLWCGVLTALKKVIQNTVLLLLAVLLLTASSGFFDFTSSGLENILAYFLISLIFLFYYRIFTSVKTDKQLLKKYIFYCFLLFGLLICTRHDLLLILFPAMVYLLIKFWQEFSIKKWFGIFIVSFAPFACFTLFSLIYYGFPFPNTAYAKLSTGIAKADLFNQGLKYFISSFRFDSITLVVVSITLLLIFFRRNYTWSKVLGCGIILNLLYVCYVGGDFMQGRFFSYTYLLSVLLFITFCKEKLLNHERVVYALLATVIIYSVVYDHTPLNSSVPHAFKSKTFVDGIADERGVYNSQLSLVAYVKNDRYKGLFPNHIYTREGYEFKLSEHPLCHRGTIGIFGYHLGINKTIIDLLALGDPLLARLPCHKNWRIGHYLRKEPEGYVESIVTGESRLKNPNINAYYTKLKILTQQEDLFTFERLKTIVLFNLGAYDHLLPTDPDY